MSEFSDLRISQMMNFINVIKNKKYSSELSSYNEWGILHRALMNYVINFTNYPYLVYRMNEFPIIIKKNWKTFKKDNPFNLLLEIIDYIFSNNIKKYNYNNSVLNEYQNIIHETFGFKKYKLLIPTNDNLLKIKNDHCVIKIYLPILTRDTLFYLQWLVVRLNKLKIKIKLNDKKSLIYNWGKIRKVLLKKIKLNQSMIK